MRLVNITLPLLAITAGVSFFSSNKNVPEGYWENSTTYVYYTSEDAIFDGENLGTAYFETSDGNVWGSYIWDSELEDGQKVTLTFENQETREEYLLAQEYGRESVTRIDNARIIAIDN